jgi:lipopolysaccharide transport protein LptA
VLALVAGPAAAARRVGVAPFERVTPAGKPVPDVAARLADRLALAGLERVVPPGELGAAASLAPASADLAKWGGQANVEAIVTGRTTRVGDRLSVDARVLDVATGRALGDPMVVEIATPADLGGSVERLASQVLARLAEPAPAPAAAAASADDGAAPRAARARERRSADGPIAINADEVEVRQSQNGGRQLLFTGHVHAVQGTMIVDCDRLEAAYPPGASSPARILCIGHVRIDDAGRTARCEQADFLRDQNRVICTGSPAEVVRECDSVKGPKITFHLDSESMNVEGGASVKMGGEGASCAPSSGAAR